jgi:hypothetical protein
VPAKPRFPAAWAHEPTNVESQNTEVPPGDADGHFDIRKSTFGNLRFSRAIQLAAGQRRD